MTLFLKTHIYIYYKTLKGMKKLCVDYLVVVIEIDQVAVATVVEVLVMAVDAIVAETTGVAETIGAVVAAITTGILVAAVVVVAIAAVVDVTEAVAVTNFNDLLNY